RCYSHHDKEQKMTSGKRTYASEGTKLLPQVSSTGRTPAPSPLAEIDVGPFDLEIERGRVSMDSLQYQKQERSSRRRWPGPIRFVIELYDASPRPWLQISSLLLWAFLVVYANESSAFCTGEGHCDFTFKDTVVGPITAILAFLIVFRTNQSYQRWWEGRCHWGELTLACSSLTHCISSIVKDETVARRMVSHTILFAYACKQHLRELPMNYREVAHLIDADEECLFQEFPSGPRMTLAGNQICKMQNQFSAMVRIKESPAPVVYRILLHFYTLFFLVLLPIYTYNDLGRWVM
ncbi:unnamed protein product, partial [Discosporangium mesarthrocarpum]